MVGKRTFHGPDPSSVSHNNATEIEVVPAVRKGRSWTTSIALPSSILQNAQSSELQMYLAGQIARACAIFCVDEIVIFSEQEAASIGRSGRNFFKNDPRVSFSNFFKTVLQYVETPQYLRKHLFPMSAQLRLVGLLNPLALPSHLARHEYSRWREGVAVARQGHVNLGNRHSFQESVTHSAPSTTRFVDVGVERLVEVDKPVEMGQRVTVDLQASGVEYAACPGKYLYGSIVPRNTPTETDGMYWGYQVREVTSLADVFRDSIVCEKYDLVLGTSERGSVLGCDSDGSGDTLLALPQFSHVLIVFGGVQGLEFTAQGDKRLQELGIGGRDDGKRGDNNSDKQLDVGELFDFYINTCASQGSRTIRTEEAILISLAALKPYLQPIELD